MKHKLATIMGLSAVLALSSIAPASTLAQSLSNEAMSAETATEATREIETAANEWPAANASLAQETNRGSCGSEASIEEPALVTSASSAFTFSDSSIDVPDGVSGYSVDGTTLTITSAGTYTITGSCSQGAIEVVEGLSGVKLVLKDLTLANDGDKVIKFKAGASGTVEIQGTNTLSTTNDEGIIKAMAVEADDGEVAYGMDGKTEGGDLTVTGSGTLNLSSSHSAVVDGETVGCDGIYAEGDLTVLSGKHNINVTGAAMHSSNTLTIGASGSTGATINVVSATEGLKGASVKLFSGDGHISASERGVSAANDKVADLGWQYAFDISGGTWTILSAGDGLDSNGNLTVSGGTTEVYCTGTTNDALSIGGGEEGEINGTFIVTGGKLFAVALNMPITPSSGDYVLFGESDATNVVESGDQVTITSNGSTLYSTTAAASGPYALFAHPSLTSGATATLTSGSASVSATVGSSQQTIDSNEGSSKQSVTLKFRKAKVTKTYGAKAFTNRLTNKSGVKVTYKSSNTTVAKVNKRTGKVTLRGPGTATITATFAGDADHEAATARYKLVVKLAKTKGLKTVCHPYARTVDVSWKKVKGAKKYQVQWRVRGGTWKTKTTKRKSLTLDGLKAKRLYEVRVRAVSGKKRGAWSTVSRRWYVPAVGVFAKAASKGRVKVNWSKTKGANAGYLVLVRYSKTGKIVARKNVGRGATSTTIFGLKSGKRAWVSVRPLRKASGKTWAGVLTQTSPVRVTS